MRSLRNIQRLVTLESILLTDQIVTESERLEITLNHHCQWYRKNYTTPDQKRDLRES